MSDTSTLDYESGTYIPKRPTLLTVLCILSFIGIGWSLYNGVYSLLTDNTADMEQVDKAMEEAHEDMAEVGGESGELMSGFLSGAADMASKAMQFRVELALTSIIASLLALFGVIMMWKLRKQGFYLYLLAQIIAIVVPLIYLGTSWMVIATFIGFGGFISLVFIILYAVNLKYMR